MHKGNIPPAEEDAILHYFVLFAAVRGIRTAVLFRINTF